MGHACPKNLIITRVVTRGLDILPGWLGENQKFITQNFHNSNPLMAQELKRKFSHM